MKPKTIKDLKKSYEKAVKNNQECFTIDGFEFVTGYAKYMLQYIIEIKKLPLDTPLKNFLVKKETKEKYVNFQSAC